jgi:hypothetical protein
MIKGKINEAYVEGTWTSIVSFETYFLTFLCYVTSFAKIHFQFYFHEIFVFTFQFLTYFQLIFLVMCFKSFYFRSYVNNTNLISHNGIDVLGSLWDGKKLITYKLRFVATKFVIIEFHLTVKPVLTANSE